MTAMDRRAPEQRRDFDPADDRALIAAVVLGVGIACHLSRSICRPINRVTDGAERGWRGELDQIVPAASRDELGELANAFNEMARTLREYRQAGTAQLAPRPEDCAGDDRFVSRSGRRGRPDRLDRASQSRCAAYARRGPRPIADTVASTATAQGADR